MKPETTRTISFKKAKKLATPGKSVVEGMLVYLPDSEGEGCRTMLAAVGTKKIDAALLAHCWNRFNKLVEALDVALHGETGLWVDDLRAVLDEAKTVELP